MKNIKIKGKITKEDAYWLTPDNKAIPVEETHIRMILDNPEFFGLKKDEVVKLYKKYKEKIGVEGKAREAIMTKLIKNGWVRLRYMTRGDLWVTQVDKLNPLKPIITAWAKAMFKKGYFPFADLRIIDLKGDVIFDGTIEEVGVGSLYDKDHGEKNYISPMAQFREDFTLYFVQTANGYLKEFFKEKDK